MPAGLTAPVLSHLARRHARISGSDELVTLARSSGKGRNTAVAQQFAQMVYSSALDLIKKWPLDSDPYLPLALGAAIEVQSNALAESGRRSEAVTYLQQQAQTFAAHLHRRAHPEKSIVVDAGR